MLLLFGYCIGFPCSISYIGPPVTMSFQSLLSTFKAATGDPRAPPKAERRRSDPSRANPSSSSAVLGTNTNPNDDTKSKANERTAPSAPAQPTKSLLEATTELWRIAEIRRSAAGMREKARSSTVDTSNGSNSSNARDGFHLAMCACVVDDLPHEEVWRRFMQKDSFEVNNAIGGAESSSSTTSIPATAEIYIHAKHPDRLRTSWARSKTISKCYKPEWNDVRIVRAMLALAEEALQDQRTTHVLFATESCVPIATLGEVAKRIVTNNKGNADWNRSFVDAYGRNSSRCTRFDERNCWDALLRSVPSDAIQKALPGWCLISRRHAESILNLPQALGGQDLWPAFTDVWAPEEVYFPTGLALCGYLAPDPEGDSDVVREPLTYSEWNERARDHKDRAHPLVFDGCFEDDKATIRRIHQDKGCTFLRKIKKPIPVRIWEDVVTEKINGNGKVTERDYHGRSSDRSHESSGRKRYRRDYDDDDRGTHDFYGRGKEDHDSYYGHSRQRRY